MMFVPKDVHSLKAPYNDALVMQLKIATTVMQQIFMDITSSINIITISRPKKLQYDEKDLEVIETPLWGLGTNSLSVGN